MAKEDRTKPMGYSDMKANINSILYTKTFFVTIRAIQKCYGLTNELCGGWESVSVQERVKIQVEATDIARALFIEWKFGPDDL